MTLHDALGNQETESNATAIIFCQLDETIENGFQLVVGNAFAGVANPRSLLMSSARRLADRPSSIGRSSYEPPPAGYQLVLAPG
jgi:hypothetical protein